MPARRARAAGHGGMRGRRSGDKGPQPGRRGPFPVNLGLKELAVNKNMKIHILSKFNLKNRCLDIRANHYVDADFQLEYDFPVPRPGACGARLRAPSGKE